MVRRYCFAGQKPLCDPPRERFREPTGANHFVARSAMHCKIVRG